MESKYIEVILHSSPISDEDPSVVYKDGLFKSKGLIVGTVVLLSP
ncbi:MAG TPA: hypothetical protein P5241_03060 [Candidatus Paceibacterota bacterium]|nr:hypothetical protein [Candidatus Paceibacterota bacterium]